jgi:DNA repair photolyase
VYHHRVARESPSDGVLPLTHLTSTGGGLPARAAAARPLQRRRMVSIRELPTASALNRCTSARMPFTRTLNPYRGCEFACVYCYARYTHTYMGLHDPVDFETKIFAKVNMPQLLRRELASTDLTGESIAVGTVTDPYQPAERRLGITRKLLASFRHVRGMTLSITTKSDLVVRDMDLLHEIARHNRVHINMTVVTLDPALARGLEPRAPRPDLRLAALATLRQEGLDAGIFAMPILPGLTDSHDDLNALAAATAAAGGQYLVADPLFVRSCIRPTLFAFLETDHPDLLRRYRRVYGRGGHLPQAYLRRLRERVKKVRAAHGLLPGPALDPGSHGNGNGKP